MAKRHPKELKDAARRLAASGVTLPELVARLGLARRTIEDWIVPPSERPNRSPRPSKKKTDEEVIQELRLERARVWIDVNTTVSGGATLVLRRGCFRLAVLGTLRRTRWDFSEAGDGKRRSLERVLPAILRRAASLVPALEVREDPSPMPCALGAELVEG